MKLKIIFPLVFTFGFLSLISTEGFSSSKHDETDNLFGGYYTNFCTKAAELHPEKKDSISNYYQQTGNKLSYDKNFGMNHLFYSLLQITISLNPHLNSDLFFFKPFQGFLNNYGDLWKLSHSEISGVVSRTINSLMNNQESDSVAIQRVTDDLIELYTGLVIPSFYGENLVPYWNESGSPYFSFEHYLEERSNGRVLIGFQLETLENGGHGNAWGGDEYALTTVHDILHMGESAPHTTFDPEGHINFEDSDDYKNKHLINIKHAEAKRRSIKFAWDKIKGLKEEHKDTYKKHKIALFYIAHELLRHTPETAYGPNMETESVLAKMWKHSKGVLEEYFTDNAATMEREDFYKASIFGENDDLIYSGLFENAPDDIRNEFIDFYHLSSDAYPAMIRYSKDENGGIYHSMWDTDEWRANRKFFYSVAAVLKYAGFSSEVYGENYQDFNVENSKEEILKLMKNMVLFVLE